MKKKLTQTENNEEELYERLAKVEATLEYFKIQIEDCETLRKTVRHLNTRMEETERRLSCLEERGEEEEGNL